MAFITEGQAADAFGEADPVLFVLYVAGAASYLRATLPTLERLFGKKRSRALAIF